MTKPLLSVCLITYNHESYILEALKGIAIQECEFDFELVIADDCSKDNTIPVIEDFLRTSSIKNYRVIRRQHNLGMQTNWEKANQECQGKYIALLEGDDYWCAPHKLQKQVNFLEANPDHSFCFHQVYEKEGNNVFLSNLNDATSEKTYTISDLAKGNFIHTPSVVFRKGYFDQLPAWFKDSPVADYVIHMLNAKHGKIKYFPEPMAVYRKHGGGVWSSKSYEKRVLGFNKTLSFLFNEFDGEVLSILKKQKAANLSTLAKMAYGNKEVSKARSYLKEAFSLDETLMEKWVSDIYPSLIERLFQSRKYQAAEMFSRLFNIGLIKKSKKM